MNGDGSADSSIVVLHYPSRDDAQLALGTIQTLAAEGFVELSEAALVTRDAEGWVTARPADTELPRDSAMGGVVGLVVGGLIGLPVLGVLAGAGIAAKKALHADHLEGLISSVGNKIGPDEVALVLTIPAVHDAETVIDRLGANRADLLSAEIPADLRAEIERQLGRPPPPIAGGT